VTTPSLLLATLLLAGPDADTPKTPPVAFRHATVIDVTGGPSKPGQTVVIEGDRIKAVGDDGTVEVPADATVVDATGKYLMPGLWDMHVHSSMESLLPLFLANGVTGARVMWGNASFGFPLGPYHYRWRKEIDEGKRQGPRLVVASNILDGPRPIWPGTVAVVDAKAGRAAVVEAKEAGADFIKVYSFLPRDAYLAIADESKKQGLPFAGHVPISVGAREASDVGQKSIEHLTGILAACSAEADVIDKDRAEALKDRPKLSDMVRFDVRAAASYSDEAAAKFFAKLKTNGTYMCPTLTVLRAIAYLDDPKFTADPRIKYMPAFFRAFWDPKADARFKTLTAVAFKGLKANFGRQKTLVGAMRKAGVEFLAGTDEMNPFVFPGFSLHDELALLVDSGFTPLEALQAATINPARYLGREATLGTVAPGKAADLLLLDADPLRDITNTTKIRAVVARGHLLDRDALDAILATAEADAKKPGLPIPRRGGFCWGH
jgi:imidazolonepropionase-like amidohydrolase